MYYNKKAPSVFLSAVGLGTILFFSSFADGQVFAKESRDLMENVEYEGGEAYHNEGDMTLTAD